MCNQVHPDAIPVWPEGFGWKFFGKMSHGCPYKSGHPYPERLYQCVGYFDTYKTPSLHSCEWLKLLGKYEEPNTEYGFCFLRKKPTEEEIRTIVKAFSSGVTDIVLRRIRYSGAMGEHLEHAFVAGEVYRIGICKQFSLVKEDIIQGEHL